MHQKDGTMNWFVFNTTNDGRRAWQLRDDYPHARIYEHIEYYEWTVFVDAHTEYARWRTTTLGRAKNDARAALEELL
jgi:hypothetical protein